jgi:hypothetical protein
MTNARRFCKYNRTFIRWGRASSGQGQECLACAGATNGFHYAPASDSREQWGRITHQYTVGVEWLLLPHQLNPQTMTSHTSKSRERIVGHLACTEFFIHFCQAFAQLAGLLMMPASRACRISTAASAASPASRRRSFGCACARPGTARFWPRDAPGAPRAIPNLLTP